MLNKFLTAPKAPSYVTTMEAARAQADYVIMLHPEGIYSLSDLQATVIHASGTEQECFDWLKKHDPASYDGLKQDDLEYIWKVA